MKLCVFRVRQLPVLALGWLCLAACADEASAPVSVARLKEVVVTASRVATPVTDVIADVTLIDRTQLDLAGQSSLRDVLAQQPGLQLVSSGSYRSNTSIFLRGATSAQTIVMVDGIRVGSVTSGGAALENIPLERIERIEILRGAASALYGPDAVGGVIQIFTREPTEALALQASLGAGTDGQQQASASVRGSDGALGYSLGVSREKARGLSVALNPALSGYNADADGFESTSADARLVAKLHRDQVLTLSLMQSDTDYQIDTAIPTGTPNPLGLSKATTDTRSRALTQTTALKWDAQWLPLWTSSVLLGSSDEQSTQRYLRESDGALGATGKFNTIRRQLGWQNDVRFDEDVATALLEGRSEAIDSSTAYAVTQRDLRSLMLSYAFNRAAWNALLVARKDDNSQFGSYNNWAVSGGYRLDPALRAVASVGTSFQAPSFNQLYFPGFGNTALVPQLNRATELGLKYQRAGLSWSALAYQNDIQGFIVPVSNVQSSLAVLRGATLAAELHAGDTTYSASYDYADPRAYSSAPASNDLRLVRVARDLLHARINQRLGDLSVFAELTLSGEREDAKVTGSGRDTLPGYGLLNVGARWKLHNNASVLARVNNLTDTPYMLANGYSMPGRNLFVSVNWAL
nr:TonB-dependent receptor [uncultured Rhodoferax sp.]